MAVWSGRARKYHPWYAEWKAENFGKKGFWKLWGNLISSIKHFQVGDGAWMAGIPYGVMDQGGSSWFGEGDLGKPKPVAMYARILEFGGDFGSGGKHPARPMFGPAIHWYRLDRAKTIAGSHLKTYVAGAWR